MGSRKLPDYRSKQKILYINNTSTDTLKSYGDVYLEASAFSDALVFYLRAGHSAGLQKIREIALENGDTFLFSGASKALNIEPGKVEWEELARKAIERKKYLFARHALEKSDNAELWNALALQMKTQETKSGE